MNHSRIRRVGVERACLLITRGEAEAVVDLHVAGYWLQQKMAGADGPSGDTTWSLLGKGQPKSVTAITCDRAQVIDACVIQTDTVQ